MPATPAPLLYADVTQSWSEVGGGVGTYLRHKRRHLLETSEASHLLVIPGARDEVVIEEGGRAITAHIRSPHVPGSPNYRLLLRNYAVRAVLERFQPALVECQDAYNLPWAVLQHARAHPETATVAAYMTDFPTVYVERPFSRFLGRTIGGAAARLCYNYCGRLYSKFDSVYALSEHGGANKLRALGVDVVDVVPLGVELGSFSPSRRDPGLRARYGVQGDDPMLVYAGRLDIEKRPQTVVDAFLALPEDLNATLVLLGDGPLRDVLVEKASGRRLHAPGFVADRDELARTLASADLYVSGMADETFGISIIEAQASGLPVVGIREGAMIDRVPPALGKLGPIKDSKAMARNIKAVLAADHRAMGEAARLHAEQFSWKRAMDQLFGDIYPHAVSAAEARIRAASKPGKAVLAEA